LAPSWGRIRKSPSNHRMVGEYIRNPALRLLPLEFPTFPQAIVKKEKGPKRKKAAATVPLLLLKFPTANRTIRGIFACPQPVSLIGTAVLVPKCEAPIGETYSLRIFILTGLSYEDAWGAVTRRNTQTQ